MAEAEPVQSSSVARGLLFLALVLPFAPPAVTLLEPVGEDPTHPALKGTAVAPVVLWFAAAPVLFAARPGRITRFVPVAARAWTVGCVLLLLHIAVAFHLGHGWSHAAAWEHTRRVGGYGWGVFVNYAFALVWLADVLWLRAAVGSYTARPRWLHRTIYAFLAFVVVNAALVFGSGAIRIVSALLVFLYLPLVTLFAGRGRASGLTSEESVSRGA